MKKSFKRVVFNYKVVTSVVLIAVLFLVIGLVKRNQDNRSKAAGSDSWNTVFYLGSGTAYKENSKKCRLVNGVCAVFDKKLNNGDSCRVSGYNDSEGDVAGVVKKGLCGGSAYTVCCTGALSSVNDEVVDTKLGEIVQDSACGALAGKCQNKADACNDGKYYTGYCTSSGSDVLCCVPSSFIFQDPECSEVGGSCQNSASICSGSYKSGLCPSGDSSVKCCVPKDRVDKTKSSIKQDSKCTNASGICKKVSEGCSGGRFLTNYCPSSGSNVKCCVVNNGR